MGILGVSPSERGVCYEKNGICRLGTPVAMILLGLLLVLCPDSVSAFMATALAWCLLLAGVVLFGAAFFIRQGTAAKVIGGAVCLMLGLWLLRN
ncbi:MAG: DUF308 domain-containing protein, partial [Plesiomonas sp.]|nr:DUF308 domain-containing protein [Plesiomonas sp.]